MSLSYDGTKVAIGAPALNKSPVMDLRGSVGVYEWNGLTGWTRLGNFLSGNVNGD